VFLNVFVVVGDLSFLNGGGRFSSFLCLIAKLNQSVSSSWIAIRGFLNRFNMMILDGLGSSYIVDYIIAKRDKTVSTYQH